MSSSVSGDTRSNTRKYLHLARIFAGFLTKKFFILPEIDRIIVL